MSTQLINIIAKELQLNQRGVQNTVQLLTEGATVPFISRYRKEMTGSLDEVQVSQIKERYEKLEELQKRKETILKTIEEQGALTDELRHKINETYEAVELEDLYLPYKPKRITRAGKAMQKGLEPLAKILMKQVENDVESRANRFVNDEVGSIDDALAGARDIIAEWVSEHKVGRDIVRQNFERHAVITAKLVKGKDEEAAKYRDYFDWSEPLKKCSSHRLLAMRRGEKEGFLKINIAPDAEPVIDRLCRYFVKGNTQASGQVEMAVEDAYKRLLKPSIETEFSNASKEKADNDSIKVFAENLRQLLLSSPLGQYRVLAIDPGYRTGCKVVCLDAQGNLVHNETIFPHPPQKEKAKAIKKIESLADAYKIEAIAIGNGTASRETEDMIRNVNFKREVQVFVVSEDGASVYSASKVAREEFPEYDVTVRGAVSRNNFV